MLKKSNIFVKFQNKNEVVGPRMRGVNTHNKFQTPGSLRPGVMGRIVSGTNKTKKIIVEFFFEILVVCPPWGGDYT